jgi:hypothetical protein
MAEDEVVIVRPRIYIHDFYPITDEREVAVAELAFVLHDYVTYRNLLTGDQFMARDT